MEALKLERIEFGYEPGSPVLSNVSLTVKESTIMAILGPNGAGKSTLLKLILGVEKPWKGGIILYGKPLKEYSPRDKARLISWVPQDPPNIPLSVYEYVLLGRAPHLGFLSTPTPRDETIVLTLLEEMDLWRFHDRPVNSLSGGERQLVMIAKAIAQESKIILMDEPTSHLDIGNKIRVLRIVKQLVNQGKTIIYTTHDPNEALLTADNTVIIHNGRILEQGETNRVVRAGNLSKIYGVKLREVELDSYRYVLPQL